MRRGERHEFGPSGGPLDNYRRRLYQRNRKLVLRGDYAEIGSDMEELSHTFGFRALI